jgi:hypothetical protein
MQAASIQDTLGTPAVRSVPMADGFCIKSTAWDGRGRSLLVCKCCSWYGDYVSRTAGGAVGGHFDTADLPALQRQADMHECPPEVRAAVEAARAARAASSATVAAS